MKNLCKSKFTKLFSQDNSIFSSDSVSKNLDRKVANYLLKKIIKLILYILMKIAQKKALKLQNNKTLKIFMI